MTERPIRVLIIDDEPDFLDMLSLRLEASGLEVTVANSGRDGLEQLAGTTFDVVLLDMLMPGMSGVQTLEEIRARGHQVEVVVMTGHGAAQDLRRCAELDAFDILIKPADYSQVLRVIREAHAHGRQ